MEKSKKELAVELEQLSNMYEKLKVLYDEKSLVKKNIELLPEQNTAEVRRQLTAYSMNEDRFNQISSQSKTVFWEVDVFGLYTYVSPASDFVWGYSADELIGKKHFYDLHPLEKWEKLKEISLRMMKDQTSPVHFEKQIQRKDGVIIWVSTNSIPVYDTLNKMLGFRGSDMEISVSRLATEEMCIPVPGEAGLITNYIAIKEDISDRKKTANDIIVENTTLEKKINEKTSELAISNNNLHKEIEERRLVEDALQSKTADLENFFDVALDLLCITDMAGNFNQVNKAWETMLGHPAEKLQKSNFLDFVHPDDIQITLDFLVELKNKQAVYNFIHRLKSKDDEYYFIEWHSVVVGQLIYASARDISDRKRAENFENELFDVSTMLTEIQYGDISKALDLALSRIGNFLQADRAYIFEINPSGDFMSNTYEWCNEGIHAEINNLQHIPCDILPEWHKSLNRNENIIILSVEDLPEKWKAECDILKPHGIKSLIVIPLQIEKNLIGFVGLDSVKRKRSYTTAEINILRLWSSMLAGLLNNQRSANQLGLIRQNYETFFNTIDDFLLVINNEGNIIHTNETVIDRLGYLNDEINNQSVMIVHPVERREEAQHIINEILGGFTDFCSVPLLTKSGKQIPVETRVKRGYWNREPVIIFVSKDISNIKLSEQKFSTAFQVNSAMMAITQYANGKHIDINNSFLEVLGYSRDEIVGKNDMELNIYIDPNLRAGIIQKLNNKIAVRKLEMQMRTKDGDLKTGLLSADSIYIGQTHCLLTVTIDITDRKKAEDEIIMARHEADKANLAKSEFLSRMSHELRTPMNSILGFAQLLQMGELTPKQAKGVNHIRQSGKHLLDLINEVLDIARIEAGKISLTMEAIPVKKVMLEVIDLLRPLANARNLTIEVINSPNDDVLVKSDYQRLKQVVINLLTNAIKYNIESGKIRIKTEMFPATEEMEGRVRILIIDTGLGILPEDLSKLFKPFERIGADKTLTEGTGLGLAVVEKLMTAMGGLIGVESKIGEGTTFWIEFPHIENTVIPDSEDFTESEPGEATVNKTGKILYIEDNSSNVYLVEQILAESRPNIELITSLTGKQALQLALEYLPDLILLDLNLPDLQGDIVLNQLQGNEKTSKIPVVIVTADAIPHKLSKLINLGAKNYITKPFEVMNFLKIVDEFINE